MTHPTFVTVEDEEEKRSLSQWLDVYSFHERLLGSGLIEWDNFATWQLKHGLERKLSPGETTDCRVAKNCIVS